MEDQPKDKIRRPKRKSYHIGAAEVPKTNADSSVSGTKMSKKDRKLELLTKELEAEKLEKAEMARQLKNLQAEFEAMKSARVMESTAEKEVSDVASGEFEAAPTASSTHHVRSVGNIEESRFLSSVNQLSISSIAVPECKPAVGDDEIHRHTFEMWRDLLMDCMALAGIEDEFTKFTVFKVKAGPRLLTIFRNTKSDAEAPDATINPFSNALHRLKLYFGSGSDVMFQRRKLALMEQKPEESDLAFVTRVGETAQLCDFEKAKEFEEIAKAVAEHARHKEVRITALKMVNRNGTFTDLVDKVREIQAIRMNEEYFAEKHGKGGQTMKAAMVAPVRVGPSKQWVPRRNFPQKPDNRYAPYSRGSFRNNQRSGKQTGWRMNSFDSPRSNAEGRNDYRQSNRCWRCYSYFHLPSECGAANLVCRKCGQLGHIQRACQPSVQDNIKRVASKEIAEIERKYSASEAKDEESVTQLEKVNKSENHDDEEDRYVIATIGTYSRECVIAATVAGMRCNFLVDSGAEVNTLLEKFFGVLKNDDRYSNGLYNIQERSDVSLKAYASQIEIEVLATFEAFLFISEDRPVHLEKFYVVKNANRCLLGRSTAMRYSVLMVGTDVPILESIVQDESIAAIEVNDPFPKFNVPPVRISYDKTRAPCRNIFSNIPEAIKPLVEKRLRELVNTDIIEPVRDGMDMSFCSSMLAIPKGKNDIRLVIDLRGPNQYIERTPFAMPTLEFILAKLNGATWFSTVDLSNAFFHIELDKESRHLTNFYTEFGIYRCVRLPFGLCNAPDVFQEVMQRIVLGGCPGVINYLDDVLIFGNTKKEHDANLAIVLSRLQQHNVKLNAEKCVYGSQSVKFVGFKLTPNGWSVTEEKLSAIKSFRTPTSCSEVKSFLGLVTFADRFIQGRADLTQHLRALANSDKFYWTENEQTEFNYLQDNALKTIQVLGYYSPTDTTELFVDASPIGLGAVLVQYNTENVPRIISCASKALTPTEQRYPQTQREALAVVWGVERFTSYLLGRSFIIKTDAEANEFIFSSSHRIGKRAVSRAESWALRLQPYDFTVKGVNGRDNLADTLSRLIHKSQIAEPFEEDDSGHFLYSLDAGSMNITWDEIEKASEEDEELQMVVDALMSDRWPKNLRKYESQKKNIRALGFLLFRGDNTILPSSLRVKALKAAHEGHVGESSMKRIMREFFWWPGMSIDTEKFVKRCETCALLSRKNPPLPLSSRKLPDGPWQILQVDFISIPGCGSGEFLVVVDTFSRFISVLEMRSMDAKSTNAALCEIFKMWGCPLILQSDNGPPFQSNAFVEYWENKGVKIRKSIPLCPQSNGAVERQNQGIIKAISASKLEGTNWRHSLQLYVHNHNNLVPHSRLRVTPFELMVGWKYRGTFVSLWKSKQLDHEDLQEKDSEAKLISKQHTDAARGAKESAIKPGDTVLVAQARKSKTDPTFSGERFKVLAREGAKIVVLSRSGVQYTRNIQDVKLAPPELLFDQPAAVAGSSTSSKSASDMSSKTRGDNSEQNPAGSITSELEPTSSQADLPERRFRDRSTVKKPARFDDRFIYHIFD